MGARYVGAGKWRLAAAIARRTAGGRATTTSGRQSGKARILQVLLLNSRASSRRTAYTEIANMNKSEVKLKSGERRFKSADFRRRQLAARCSGRNCYGPC